MFCCAAEAKLSSWNLFKLASYGMFGISRTDLDGNKLARGKCLTRTTRDKKKCNVGRFARHYCVIKANDFTASATDYTRDFSGEITYL